jgi:hypothetical protein
VCAAAVEAPGVPSAAHDPCEVCRLSSCASLSLPPKLLRSTTAGTATAALAMSQPDASELLALEPFADPSLSPGCASDFAALRTTLATGEVARAFKAATGRKIAETLTLKQVVKQVASGCRLHQALRLQQVASGCNMAAHRSGLPSVDRRIVRSQMLSKRHGAACEACRCMLRFCRRNSKGGEPDVWLKVRRWTQAVFYWHARREDQICIRRL